MKRLRPLALTLTMVCAGASGLSALDGNNVAHASGTIALFNDPHTRIGGCLDLSDPHGLVFVADTVPQGSASLRIRYSAIHDLEFGQKVRRRLAASAGSTALLGPIGLVALTTKKRQHYLTIVYTDDRGLNQVVILELGTKVVRSTLAAIEARAGIAIEYQDENARRWR
jgi:hypothetical protein